MTFNSNWVPKLIFGFSFPLVMQGFRRLAPKPSQPRSISDYRHRQVPKPFPPGVIGGFMWFIGISLALSFFLFQWANHIWAQMEGPADVRLYPGRAIWFFFPIFAALSIPWPFTISLLRRYGRTDEADSIATESAEKAGMDSYRVLKWLSIWLAAPIGAFTLMAIPMHLSIVGSEIRVTGYASMTPEVFPLTDAKRAILVAGTHYKDGSFKPQQDLILDFSDGRRLDIDPSGEKDQKVVDQIVQLVLARSGLSPELIQTKDDLPPL